MRWARFFGIRILAIAAVAAVVTFFQAVTTFYAVDGTNRLLMREGLSAAARSSIFWHGVLTEEASLFTLQFHLPPGEVLNALGVSLLLVVGSVLVAALFAVPIGIYAAVYEKRWFAHLGPLASLFLQGIPTFVLAVWLQIYVADTWHLLPALGWTSPASAVLPTLALAGGNVGYLAKFMQAGMTDALRQDYILGAKARGLPRRRVIWRHALRPAATATVTFFGTQAAYLINNTLVIQTLFAVPGISGLLGESMYGPPGLFPGVATPFGTTGNVPVVFFLFAVITMLFNLMVDVSYRFLDPRATDTI